MGETVHSVLERFIRRALNDEPRPATLIDEPLVLVTKSLDRAVEAYVRSVPFVLITEGPYESEFERFGAEGTGRRHEMTFLLELALAGKNDAQANPVQSAAQNRKLRDAVRDAVERGYLELQAEGVTVLDFSADAERQRDTSAINPHKILVEVFSIDTTKTDEEENTDGTDT